MVGMTFSTVSSTTGVFAAAVDAAAVVGPAKTMLLTCNDVAVSSFCGTVGRAIGSSDAFDNMGRSATGPRTTELPTTSVNDELFSKSCVVGRWTLPLSTGVALFLAVSPIIKVASVPPVPSLLPMSPPLPFPSTDKKLYDETLSLLRLLFSSLLSFFSADDDDDVSVKYDTLLLLLLLSAGAGGGMGGDGNG